jgi:hypothetical protein
MVGEVQQSAEAHADAGRGGKWARTDAHRR